MRIMQRVRPLSVGSLLVESIEEGFINRSSIIAEEGEFYCDLKDDRVSLSGSVSVFLRGKYII